MLVIKSYSKILILLGVLVAMPLITQAQGSETYGKGIRINLDTTGKKYIRFITWHQFWTRFQTYNPGTQVNGQDRTDDWDIGLRRSRFLWYTQISPRFLILTHFGINNQTFVNGGGSGTAGTGGYGVGKKPQLFIHDMWTEYAVIKDKLSIGTGLHYWNGVSRLANASTLNFLALDAPIFNWALIEESDQFARQFGIYAKGKIGKIDYRIALNKPFATPNTEANLKTNAYRAYSFNNNNWASAGYLAWEFFDKESNVLPFTVGTHLGTKKVFNIGFGWHYQKDATRSYQGLDANGADKFNNHDMLLLGVDAFLDMPLNKEKGSAITAYAGYYKHDFGPNYVRAIGIMNEGTSAPTGALAQGSGNTDWRIGTGSILYSELGYLLPKNFLVKVGRIQPFGTLTYKKFDFLKDASINYGLGLNYLLDGHHAKISLKYQTRTLYSNADQDFNRQGYNPASFSLDPANVRKLEVNKNPNIAGGNKSAGEFIIQTMIYL